MGFVEAIKSGFLKYFTFSGRASRSEYWYFVLFLLLAGIVIAIVDSAIFGPTTTMGISTTLDSSGNISESEFGTTEYGTGPISDLWGLVTLVPLLSLGWRRLHDTSRPGWYLLVPIIITIILIFGLFASTGLFTAKTSMEAMIAMRQIGPGKFVLVWLACFASFITLLVMLCRKSQPGPNRYGPTPPEVTP